MQNICCSEICFRVTLWQVDAKGIDAIVSRYLRSSLVSISIDLWIIVIGPRDHADLFGYVHKQLLPVMIFHFANDHG